MGEQVKKIGAITILMWMIGLFIIPVIAYIASNALKMPTIETHLGHMVKTQHEIISELKSLKKSNIELSKSNLAEHRAIVEMINPVAYGLQSINERCENNIADIKDCQDDIDYIKNGWGN